MWWKTATVWMLCAREPIVCSCRCTCVRACVRVWWRQVPHKIDSTRIRVHSTHICEKLHYSRFSKMSANEIHRFAKLIQHKFICVSKRCDLQPKKKTNQNSLIQFDCNKWMQSFLQTPLNSFKGLRPKRIEMMFCSFHSQSSSQRYSTRININRYTLNSWSWKLARKWLGAPLLSRICRCTHIDVQVVFDFVQKLFRFENGDAFGGDFEVHRTYPAFQFDVVIGRQHCGRHHVGEMWGLFWAIRINGIHFFSVFLLFISCLNSLDTSTLVACVFHLFASYTDTHSHSRTHAHLRVLLLLLLLLSFPLCKILIKFVCEEQTVRSSSRLEQIPSNRIVSHWFDGVCVCERFV